MHMRCVGACHAGAGSAGTPRGRRAGTDTDVTRALTTTALSVTPFSARSSDLPVSEAAFSNQCHCTGICRSHVSSGLGVLAVSLKKILKRGKKGKRWGGKSFQSDFVVSVCVCPCWCSGILVLKNLLQQRTSCSWCYVNCMYHIHPENINKGLWRFLYVSSLYNFILVKLLKL